MKAPLVTAFVLCAGLSAQPMTWVQVANTGPSARTQHAMVYDSQRHRTVLFGGWVPGSPPSFASDTWEWDSVSWTRVATTGPSARQSMAVAYDSQRGRVVLFGGWDGTYRGDTWEWDGTAWIPQVLATGPAARIGHAMTYDSLRGRVVMFGGQDQVGFFNDTWEWDGSVWVAASPGLGARAGHAMAFDTQRGRTVLVGGFDPLLPVPALPVDTWEWDGTSWAQVSLSAPQLAGHAAAFDSLRGTTVVVGGWNDGVSNLLVFEWNGTSWTVVPVNSPLDRSGHAIAFDAQRGRTVLFGGVEPSFPSYPSATWELAPTSATGIPFGSGCGTPPLTLSPNLLAPPTINTVAHATVSNAPSPLAFVALGLSNTTFGPFTLPVTLSSIGMPGCDLLQSTDVVGESTTPTSATTADYAFTVPGNPLLAGFHVFLQAWAWAPGANAANIVASNGLDWRLGL